MNAVPASCYSWQDGPYEGDGDPEAVWCEAHEAFYTESHPCGACERETLCPGCRAILSGAVEVAGEWYCRECATEMLRDMTEAMKR